MIDKKHPLTELFADTACPASQLYVGTPVPASCLGIARLAQGIGSHATLPFNWKNCSIIKPQIA
jgi:hypothetical protein